MIFLYFLDCNVFAPTIHYSWRVSLIIDLEVVTLKKIIGNPQQGCISCGMCSYPELTKDHVLTSAYVYIFRTVTRNAVNKSV